RLAGGVLSNVDNTIEGGGAFASGLQLMNMSGGTIVGNRDHAQLVLNTGSAVVNRGLLAAAGSAGVLVLNTAIDNTSGGVLSAASGSHLDLQNAIIHGG